MSIEKNADDTILAYKCVDCGQKTTEWRRIRIAGKIGNTSYETFKCPYCRGRLEKVDLSKEDIGFA